MRSLWDGSSRVKLLGSNPGSLLRSKSTRHETRCEAACEWLAHEHEKEAYYKPSMIVFDSQTVFNEHTTANTNEVSNCPTIWQKCFHFHHMLGCWAFEHHAGMLSIWAWNITPKGGRRFLFDAMPRLNLTLNGPVVLFQDLIACNMRLFHVYFVYTVSLKSRWNIFWQICWIVQMEQYIMDLPLSTSDTDL